MVTRFVTKSCLVVVSIPLLLGFAKGGEGGYAAISFVPDKSTHLTVNNTGEGWSLKSNRQELFFRVTGASGKQRKYKSWKSVLGTLKGKDQDFSQKLFFFNHGATNKPSDYDKDGAIDFSKSLGNNVRGNKYPESREISFEGLARSLFHRSAIERICENEFLKTVPTNKKNNKQYKDSKRGGFSTTKMIGLKAYTELVVTAPPSTKGLYRRGSTYQQGNAYVKKGIPENFKVECKSAHPATQQMAFVAPTASLTVNQAQWITNGNQNRIVLRVRNEGNQKSVKTDVQVRIVEDGKNYWYWGELKALNKNQGTSFILNFPNQKYNFDHSKAKADKAIILIKDPYKREIDLLNGAVVPAG